MCEPQWLCLIQKAFIPDNYLLTLVSRVSNTVSIVSLAPYIIYDIKIFDFPVNFIPDICSNIYWNTECVFLW